MPSQIGFSIFLMLAVLFALVTGPITAAMSDDRISQGQPDDSES